MLAQAVEHLIKNIVDFPDDVSVKRVALDLSATGSKRPAKRRPRRG